MTDVPPPPPPLSGGNPSSSGGMPPPPPPPGAMPPMPPMAPRVPGFGGAQHTGTNGLSIASLVLGILSIPMCFIFLPAILAVALGIVGLIQITKRPGQAGRGIAIAGIILGAIGLALPVLVFFAMRDADAAFETRTIAR